MPTPSYYHTNNTFFLLFWTKQTSIGSNKKSSTVTFLKYYLSVQKYQLSQIFHNYHRHLLILMTEMQMHQKTGIQSQSGSQSKKACTRASKNVKGICSKIKHFHFFLSFHTILFFLTLLNSNTFFSQVHASFLLSTAVSFVLYSQDA